MATEKPQIKAYTNDTTIKKLTVIAKRESRSVSKQIEYIANKYIEAYEKEHGEIKIEEENNAK